MFVWCVCVGCVDLSVHVWDERRRMKFTEYICISLLAVNE